MIDSLPSNTYRFNSTFAGIPVEIEYEIEVSEDHRGADVYVLPMVCILNGHEVDLCEDAGLFHPQQLQTWLAEAEAHAKDGGNDFDGGDYTPDAYDAAAAEDRWIAQLDHAHYSRAGV
ncbi:hypothetical protein [Azohydromonas aeria]|uniref:hypothetical protein n=1 Tax=Azohydromonas aeria TaxID=2590212 RepID=UPI0012FA0D07|nr:hypothetical protein [Azohydromonas aeria]